LGQNTVPQHSKERYLRRELLLAAGLCQTTQYRFDCNRVHFVMAWQSGPVKATTLHAGVDWICGDGGMKDGENRYLMATFDPTIGEVDANAFRSSSTQATDNEGDAHGYSFG
jgi:hypothetical protein